MDADSRRWIEGTLAVATFAVTFAWAASLLAISRRAGGGATPAQDTLSGASFGVDDLLWVAAATALAGGAATLMQRSAERRGVKRHQCRLGFKLDLFGAAFTASLLDISERGAQVKIRGFSLSPGEPVTLLIGDVRQRASVVWSKDRKAGVRFDEEMPYDAFRAVLNRARKRGRLLAGDEAK